MAARTSEWTKGVELEDGGIAFPDVPITADVVDWEKRELPDGTWECRAIYRSGQGPA